MRDLTRLGTTAEAFLKNDVLQEAERRLTKYRAEELILCWLHLKKSLP